LNLNLVVINKKNVTTCKRYQGESVVDITMVNQYALDKVTSWRVEEEHPIVSDHCVISMQIINDTSKFRYKRIVNKFPRWNYKKVNVDFLQGSAECLVWGSGVSGDFLLNSLVKWMNSSMRILSDSSMPRSNGGHRKATYWWNNEIADLRTQMIGIRRKITRYGKNVNRNVNSKLLVDRLYIEYREIVKKYKNSIRKKKKRIIERDV
jgi:hypothetical protein